MTQDAEKSIGLRRVADALLCGSGAGGVKLRIPAPAVGGDSSEQLGLAVPQFQDVAVSPAVFRNAAAKSARGKASERELMISATAIEALTSSEGYGSANALFASAFGVLVDDVLLTIVSAMELEAGSGVYAYRLSLREPIENAP